MFSVKISNFQSIEDLEIDIDRFTVLVGRSNIGKSAIVRAIKAALTNALGTAFVRHGATCARQLKGVKTCKCQTTVHITSEGFDLLWEKGDSVNRYTYNGAVYDSVDRGVPSFLQEAGFQPLKIGDRSEPLQIAEQFFPIFLLDQSGGVAAEVISDVARLDAINEAMRLAEKDKKDAAASRKVKERDVEELNLKIMSFDGLDQTAGRARDLHRKEWALLERQSKGIESLTAYIDTFSMLTGQIGELAKAEAYTVPNCDELLTTQERGYLLGKLSEQFVQRGTAVKALLGVDKIEVPELLLTEANDRLTRLEGWVGKVNYFKDSPTKLPDIVSREFADPVQLVEIKDKLMTLYVFSAKHTALMKALGDLESQCQESDFELRAVMGEINALGVCPTCLSPVEIKSHEHRGVESYA